MAENPELREKINISGNIIIKDFWIGQNTMNKVKYQMMNWAALFVTKNTKYYYLSDIKNFQQQKTRNNHVRKIDQVMSVNMAELRNYKSPLFHESNWNSGKNC